MQVVIFTFREIEFPSKNISLVRLVSTQLPGFFEKFRKNGGGHRALGRPQAGSVFALVQRRSLLSPKRCHKHVNTANDKFQNSETCEHLLKDKMGAGVRCSMHWRRPSRPHTGSCMSLVGAPRG
jgi:hypothetical protein